MSRTQEPADGHRRDHPACGSGLRDRSRRRVDRSGSSLLVNIVSALLSLAAIVLYAVGYTMRPQAPDQPEHRLGRRRRLHADAHRLGRGHRHASSGRPSSSSSSSSSGPHRTTGRCRWRSRTTTPTPTCRCCRCAVRALVVGPPDRRLRLGHGRHVARPRPGRVDGLALPRRGRWRAVRCSSPRRTGWSARPASAPTQRTLKPMRLFHLSITYVTVVFLAVARRPARSTCHPLSR